MLSRGGVQRPAEDARGAARPRGVRAGHHRPAEGAAHHPQPHPALRVPPAARRRARGAWSTTWSADAGLERRPRAPRPTCCAPAAGSARDTLSALDQVVAAGRRRPTTVDAVDELVEALCEHDTGRGPGRRRGRPSRRGRDPGCWASRCSARLRDVFLAVGGRRPRAASPRPTGRGSPTRPRRLGAPGATRALEVLGEAFVGHRQDAPTPASRSRSPSSASPGPTPTPRRPRWPSASSRLEQGASRQPRRRRRRPGRLPPAPPRRAAPAMRRPRAPAPATPTADRGTGRPTPTPSTDDDPPHRPPAPAAGRPGRRRPPGACASAPVARRGAAPARPTAAEAPRPSARSAAPAPTGPRPRRRAAPARPGLGSPHAAAGSDRRRGTGAGARRRPPPHRRPPSGARRHRARRRAPCRPAQPRRDHRRLGRPRARGAAPEGQGPLRRRPLGRTSATAPPCSGCPNQSRPAALRGAAGPTSRPRLAAALRPARPACGSWSTTAPPTRRPPPPLGRPARPRRRRRRTRTPSTPTELDRRPRGRPTSGLDRSPTPSRCRDRSTDDDDLTPDQHRCPSAHRRPPCPTSSTWTPCSARPWRCSSQLMEAQAEAAAGRGRRPGRRRVRSRSP